MNQKVRKNTLPRSPPNTRSSTSRIAVVSQVSGFQAGSVVRSTGSVPPNATAITA